MVRKTADRPRLTHPALLVLKMFMDDPLRPLCGAEIIKATGLASGTLYPILLRFEKTGVLESRWEAEKPSITGRPRKRLYKLTSRGAQVAHTALEPFSVTNSGLPAFTLATSRI